MIITLTDRSSGIRFTLDTRDIDTVTGNAHGTNIITDDGSEFDCVEPFDDVLEMIKGGRASDTAY